MSFKVRTQLGTEFFILHVSIRINFDRISKGLQYCAYCMLTNLHNDKLDKLVFTAKYN
jgi:hypothetical protein